MNKLFLYLLLAKGTGMNLFAFSNPVELDVDHGICRIDKISYPIVGFGTYPLTGEVCVSAVQQAVENGYRILDTATYYENFDDISKALKDQDRHLFYIISKVWHDRVASDDLCADLNQTLRELKTDYLDAYLIHWPNSKIPIEETLHAMNELRKESKIRHIGLCNVSVNHLKRALEVGVPITWVQTEMHPFYYDSELLNFCNQHAITVQAWRPLSLGQVKEDVVLNTIGEKYNKTACQIALKRIIQHGCIPLPGSKNAAHVYENFDIVDFALSEKDMAEIDSRASKGIRFRLKKECGLGFTDELDFSYEECWPKF